jgi:hypothetical protein
MASFTRDWDEANPTDKTYAYEIDEYNRYLRVDCSDRLKAMVYGFTAGENDGNPGFKKATFKQQSSAAATPNADEIVLYSIDDGTNCGLYGKNEDGYAKQVLKKSGSNLILNVDDNDGAVVKTGAQTAAGVKTFSDQASFTSGLTSAAALVSTLATGTAPLTIASTTKVTNLNADKVDGYDVSAYAGEESYTFPGGLIIKGGTANSTSDNEETFTFGTAFPNAVLSISITRKEAGATSILGLSSFTTASFKLNRNDTIDGTVPFYWIAIGY